MYGRSIMQDAWDTIETTTVRSQNKINIPAPIQDVIVFDHLAYGPSVHWHVNTNQHVAILSNQQLNDDRYVHMARTDVLGGDKAIRPPNEVVDALSRPIYKNLTVAYLAHEAMTTGEKRSMYLLTESQVFDLIGPDSDERTSLREVLTDTPSFLPAPQ